jgi:hypothetical protein
MDNIQIKIESSPENKVDIPKIQIPESSGVLPPSIDLQSDHPNDTQNANPDITSCIPPRFRKPGGDQTMQAFLVKIAPEETKFMAPPITNSDDKMLTDMIIPVTTIPLKPKSTPIDCFTADSNIEHKRKDPSHGLRRYSTETPLLNNDIKNKLTNFLGNDHIEEAKIDAPMQTLSSILPNNRTITDPTEDTLFEIIHRNILDENDPEILKSEFHKTIERIKETFNNKENSLKSELERVTLEKNEEKEKYITEIARLEKLISNKDQIIVSSAMVLNSLMYKIGIENFC